jgi:predicted MFS family arabinose efflux permease
MWLAKPVYEALPYYYVGIGVAALAARLYVDWWYWPAICTAVGVLGIAGGVLVWLKRRGSRRPQ